MLLAPLLSFGQMFGNIGYYFVPATPTTSSNEWTATISHTMCGTANTDTMTILVKLQSDTLKHTSRGGYVRSMLGNDIRFYKTDTNTLGNWVKERYDPDSGIVIMHVKQALITYSVSATFKMDVGRTYDTSTFHGGDTINAWKSTVLAAYFMNDATGSNLTDYSGRRNHATQTNSPVRSQGLVGYAEGMTAASSQYYTTALTGIDGLGAASMLFLGKRTASNTNVVHGKHSGANAFVGYVYSDGVIYFQINNKYGYFTNTGTSWHNYAMVFDGSGSGNSGRCKIYLNGVNQSLLFVGTIDATISSAGYNFRIGKDGDLGDLQSGMTDNLIIYREAVSSSLITTWNNNINNPGNLGETGKFITWTH